MNKIKQFFAPPSAKTLAADELAQAERSLLEAQTAAEYARNMVVYQRERIERLKAYLEGKA